MKKVGVGTRALNGIVDTLIIFLLSLLAYHGWRFYVFYYNIPYIPYYYFFWAIIFLYYLFFESIFSRTPGKWLSISKVVNRKGKKPSFFQILLRTFIRLTIVDCFFIPFLDETLHDFVSKTEVIEA